MVIIYLCCYIILQDKIIPSPGGKNYVEAAEHSPALLFAGKLGL
jgi:hypothetical protein